MKSAHVLAICVVAALVLGSSSFTEAADGEYDYTTGPLGQANWGNLPGAELCKTGKMQSPMKITKNNMVPDPALDKKLQAMCPTGNIPVSVYNTGKTVEVDLKGCKVTIDKTTFESAQFHIHYPSEHVISDTEYALELHLVHFEPVTKKIAVIGWFFKVGEASEFLGQFIKQIPAAKEKVAIAGGIKFTLTSGAYGRYMGSLTTPPCSEHVIWTLNLENIYSVSQDQLDELKTKFPRNDRDEQAAYGRELRTSL